MIADSQGKIIVSLTSYPLRIDSAIDVANQMLRQTVLPDKVIIYLCRKQFDNTSVYKNIIDNDTRIEIHWVEDDIKAHKKYFYAFKEFPDDTIITIDDDFIYPNTLVEELMQNSKDFPNAVLSRRVHRIVFEDEYRISNYCNWVLEDTEFINEARYDLCATNGAGSLFPPHIFAILH